MGNPAWRREVAVAVPQPCESRPLLPASLVLPWAVLLGLAVVLTLGLGVQRADYPTPFKLSHVYRLLAGAEAFFFLVVVPLAAGGPAGPTIGLLSLATLWVMAAPAVALAAWVADLDWPAVAASQGYLLAVAGFAAGYLRLDAQGRGRGAYWLALATLGAAAPMAAFLIGDLARANLDWLYPFSPFWVADRLNSGWEFGWDWAVPFAALAALACALLARRKGVGGQGSGVRGGEIRNRQSAVGNRQYG